MLRGALVLAVITTAATISVQVASADPTNAKNSTTVTLVCGSEQIQVATNGNGEFTPGHDVGSSAVFVPTAFNLTFSFTPTGGTTQSDTDTSAKHSQARNSVTCTVPLALNTFTTPDGIFSISGTVTGFSTPAKA
jgi:hypothetical protein